MAENLASRALESECLRENDHTDAPTLADAPVSD